MKKTESLFVRATKDTKSRLETICKLTDCSQAEVIETSLTIYEILVKLAKLEKEI